ncbi:MAG TPA: DNA polymerase IV [Candidatus Binataceae bacterium]|nr:DNA polymerase IV [Candidatus Binataceae bacterium]
MAAQSAWPAVIAHADMDAFYASVEQLDHPELRGLPVIVGGRSARGVVASASYEARRFGVRAAMPGAQAMKLCPQAVFVAGRMTRYSEISRQIREIFYSFTPLVEPLSLDEAFLDLTGTERLLGSPQEIGRALRRRVREQTGLVVSVGIAPIKMVAKILSDMSKPDGLLMLGPEYLDRFLQPLPVERLWGVGRVTLERLQAANIRTIGDLARAAPGLLANRLGSLGAHLAELARGSDPRPVNPDWQRKSYGEESTFERDLALNELELKRTLIAHGEALARRLRADSVQALTVTLKLKLARPLGGGRYPILTRSHTLTSPTADGDRITRTALALLGALKLAERVRLAGVQVHNLRRASASQLDLFAEGTNKRARLNDALDELAHRFGEDAVVRGLARATRASPTTRIK